MQPNNENYNNIINYFIELNNINKNTNQKTLGNIIDKIYFNIYFLDNLSNYEKSNLMIYLIIFIFNTRDFRNNGKGLRKQSRILFLKLHQYFPRTIIKLLKVIPKYGSWKDYNLLIKHCNDEFIHDNIYGIYAEQLKKDNELIHSNLENKISLAAKWVPKEGKSLDRRFGCTGKIIQLMFTKTYFKNNNLAFKKFRKMYSSIQKVLKTTEIYECSDQYDLIDFKDVPKKCLDKKLLSYMYINKDGTSRGLNTKRIKCRENIFKYLDYKIDLTPKKTNYSDYINNWTKIKVALNDKYYDIIREIVENVSEGIFKHYTIDTYSDLPDLISDSTSYSSTLYDTSSYSSSDIEENKNLKKLRLLKTMLDDKLITQNDYDIYKKAILENIK